MKIGLEPSTQLTSVGNGIAPHVEAELCQDVTRRLKPKLEAAGHTVMIFAGKQDANSDGANALVAWHPHLAVSLHLDSSDGGGHGALLCYQEQRSLAMGMKVLATYCAAMGYTNRGPMKRTPGTNGVAVIRIPEAAGIPTALIEMGSMDKPDGPLWTDPAHREKAAVCMAKAICAVAGGVTPGPQPDKREDEMSMYDKEGADVFFGDLYVDRYDYWLHTIGAAGNVVFHLLEHASNMERSSQGQSVSLHKAHEMRAVAATSMAPDQKPVKGSYTLRCTADRSIKWTLREIPK